MKQVHPGTSCNSGVFSRLCLQLLLGYSLCFFPAISFNSIPLLLTNFPLCNSEPSLSPIATTAFTYSTDMWCCPGPFQCHGYTGGHPPSQRHIAKLSILIICLHKSVLLNWPVFLFQTPGLSLWAFGVSFPSPAHFLLSPLPLLCSWLLLTFTLCPWIWVQWQKSQMERKFWELSDAFLSS